MKITEILTEIYRTDVVSSKRSYNDMRKTLNNRMKLSDSPSKTGEGHYAVVLPNARDPHTIRKLSKRKVSDHNDGYHPFADWVVNNPEIKSNPHFPKIYKKRAITDDEGTEEIVDYVIEKLTPIDKLNMEQIIAILDTYFKLKLDYSPSYIPKEEDTDYVIEEEDIDYIIESFSLIIRDYIQRGRSNIGEILSDQLIQACRALRDFYSESHMYNRNVDTHRYNIMYRLGAHTPIPVITDPFA